VTFSTCSGSEKAREYWFELLIAFLAMAGMLEVVVGRDSPGRAPRTTLGDRRTCRDGPCTAPLRQLSISIISPTCWTVPDQQQEHGHRRLPRSRSAGHHAYLQTAGNGQSR
jgi:hypothetical protein